ncbi:TIGD1, partial [Symbiodinium necroappetens]
AGEGADAKNKKRKRKDGKVKLTRGANKRQKITSIFKSDVLHKLWEFQEHNDPTPFQTEAQEMGVNPSLVSKWAKSAQEVLKTAAEERKRLTFRHLPPLRKHIFRRSSRPSLWKEMETAVLEMMKTRRDEQKRIGTAWIARKGLQWLKDNDAALTWRGRPFKDDKWGAFPPVARFNCDSTGINSFLMPDHTYAGVAERKEGRVAVDNPGKHGNKRVATLHLTLCGDEESELLRPLLIFKGKGRVLDKEVAFYHSSVKVAFQENAWLDLPVLKTWYTEEFLPYKQDKVGDARALLLLDNLSTQRDEGLLKMLQAKNVECFFGPANLTHRWQPVDQGFAAHFKSLMMQGLEAYLDKNPDVATDFESGNMEARNERILLTQIVGEAFLEICDAKYNRGRRAYWEKTGCLIARDGSTDEFMKIEGLGKDYKPFPPGTRLGPNYLDTARTMCTGVSDHIIAQAAAGDDEDGSSSSSSGSESSSDSSSSSEAAPASAAAPPGKAKAPQPKKPAAASAAVPPAKAKAPQPKKPAAKKAAAKPKPEEKSAGKAKARSRPLRPLLPHAPKGPSHPWVGHRVCTTDEVTLEAVRLPQKDLVVNGFCEAIDGDKAFVMTGGGLKEVPLKWLKLDD